MALPPPRLGFNTSLYQSIPPEAATFLEHAIWLKTIGQTETARSVFDQELKPFSNAPIVVIEHADLELEAGNWGRVWRLLDAALGDLKDRNADLNLPEHRLMALTWALVGTRNRGQIGAAIQELERTRLWLWNVPVTEYTDIQTSCIRRYVIASLLVRLGSSYAVPDCEGIPMPIENTDGTRAHWAGLRDLWQRLLDSRLFIEANSLFRVVVNRTELPERDKLFEQMLGAIGDRSVHLGRHHMESSIRLQWAETYVLLHNIPRAMEEAKKSQALLDRFCEEFSILNSAAVPQNLFLKFQELYFEQDLSQKLHSAEKLIEIMEQYGSSKKGSCIETAANTALTLFQNTGDEKLLAKYFGLYKRLQEYDETESEDLCDLITHRNSLMYFTISNVIDQQKSLEWIEGFLQEYTYFESPTELQLLHTSRAMLLKSLRRIREAADAQKVADSYGAAVSPFGKYLNMSQTVAQGLDSTEYESEDEGEPFFTQWAKVIGDTTETSKMIVDSVLRWASDDLVADRLTVKEFREMFSLPEDIMKDASLVEDDEYLKRIKTYPSLDFFTHNLFPPNNSDMAHEKRCELICHWLSKSVKGQRNKRLFCSILLRNVRQYHFAEKRLWALQISEINHLLTLHEKAPRLVQWISRSFKSGWLGSLALSYQAQLQATREVEEIDALFLKAEKYNDLAVETFRTTNEVVQIAIQQRVGADLSLSRIHRLKGLLDLDATDSQQSLAISREEIRNEITTRRQIGLEKIEETDKIFTASELQASWLSGLQGISERQTLSAFYNSFWAIETAIQLLMSGVGELSQDDITNVWRWVQKYKARSLSRSIGMHRDSPSGLVSLILASDDDRDIYVQMLDLQQQIDKAEKRSRFHLHQKMDALRQKMKEHELLRQLIDLREGTPFDLSDIEAISAQVKAPIVLVDWFILQNHPEGSGGRALLLTARAGSAPTLDILNTKLDEIAAWQQDYLNPSKFLGRPPLASLDANNFSKSLGSLVTPLAHRTQEGEVLVFCPTNTLHRLPLHALSVTDKVGFDEVPKILIQRNPIVYIHSHSLLRSCMSASGQGHNQPGAMRPQFASGILEDEIYEAGRSSIQILAQKFAVKPLIDQEVSKTIFIRVAPESRMLHLQTHCGWDSSDPLNHFLEFPRPHGDTAAATSDWQLTAREVFDIKLVQGTHINMIACQGGLTEVKLGDEVMGLVPALLYSGASSTISTLWSIVDPDGAKFSLTFFKSFIRQSAEMRKRRLSSFGEVQNQLDDKKRAPGFVDTAKAFQDAVLAMGIYESNLYHWAGFVLHGFWQFPLCDVDIERF